MEADRILLATGEAKATEAWLELSESDRAAIAAAEAELVESQSIDDHRAIRMNIQILDQLTSPLAQAIMNRAAQTALRGKQI